MSSFHEHYSRFYRDVTTSRGFKYHYLAVPASDHSKPTLLLIHGFPSSSYDWHHQIGHFHEKGYGLIVPDMLGYGGTDKPEDTSDFRLKLLAQDIIDILDKESPESVVGVAHDWGSVVLSRLANYHSTRFIAFAWLAVSYVSPAPEPMDLEVVLPWMKQTFGAELLAYQEFLLKPEAPQLLETNFESYIDLGFPEDPAHWKETMTTRGGMEDWITKNKRGGRARWLLSEYVEELRRNLLSGGLNSPLNYYRLMAGEWNCDDEKELAKTAFKIDVPVFFGAALRDYVCIPAIHIAAVQSVANDLTIFNFDTGHWVYLEEPDKVNSQLDAWLTKKVI